MGCLRTFGLVVSGTALGALLGWLLGGSLIPVPEFVLDWARGLVGGRSRELSDGVARVQGYARLAGHVWGALQGALYGLVAGGALAALLAYRSRRRY